MTDMKFQTGLSFVSVYMKKSYRDGRETVVCNSLAKLLVHFENKYAREKKHEKTIIINWYIKYITT